MRYKYYKLIANNVHSNRRWSSLSDESAGDQNKLDLEKYVDRHIHRKRRNVELTLDTRFVVYAFKNCLPSEPDR